MDEKVEAMGKTITVNESKSTLIKWIFISTTAVFLVTTVVFIALYANEKGKDKEVEYKDLYNNIHITNEWDKVF